MNILRFWIALWAGKFFLWLWKITGNERDDRPGMASVRLCEDFLARVKKPKLTIVITGTNGKTTVTAMVANMLREMGYTVAYNDWGANHNAGQARCLLDAVNIFNRSTKDAAVVEADELLSPINVPRIAPQYVLITNVARDSMLRNAHPEYIAERLKEATALTPNAVVIVNADDPLSRALGEQNRRLTFGVSDQQQPVEAHRIDDFAVCPRCGATPQYRYRNYRHIGDYTCMECGLSAPSRDYFAVAVSDDKTRVTVREPSGEYIYPLISASVHQIYNTVAVIALFRDKGVSPEEIARCIAKVTLPASRETRQTVGGIELISQMAKGQNATAASTVFECVARDDGEKEVVLMLDEVFDDPKKSETVAWIYDSDYEFLNHPRIRRIVVGGERYLDHRLRLRLAGVPEERIVCVRDPLETAAYIDPQGLERIYVLHDVNSVTRGRLVRDAIKERILREGGKAQ